MQWLLLIKGALQATFRFIAIATDAAVRSKCKDAHGTTSLNPGFKGIWGLLLIACALSACEPSPLDRCVSARLKVWDSNSEKTPWRISEATGQTRSQFEAKARSWCEQEAGH